MRRRTRGNMLLEGILWIPFMVLLVVGTIQFGKVYYTYYSLRKAVFSAAKYLAAQQNTNFCDLADDINAQTALNLAVNDPNSGNQLISGFTSSNLLVSTECVDPVSGAVVPCDVSQCGSGGGAQRPDYIVVGVTGFTYPIRIPLLNVDPIPLSPQVTVAFMGSGM